MAMRERYDLEDLKNEVEDFVFNELESQLDRIKDDLIPFSASTAPTDPFKSL